MSASENKVDFRILNPALLDELDARAKKNNLNRAGYARKLLEDALTREGIKDEIETMNGQMKSLRKDIATMVQAMLVQFAKWDPNRAHEWVRDRFSKG